MTLIFDEIAIITRPLTSCWKLNPSPLVTQQLLYLPQFFVAGYCLEVYVSCQAVSNCSIWLFNHKLCKFIMLSLILPYRFYQAAFCHLYWYNFLHSVFFMEGKSMIISQEHPVFKMGITLCAPEEKESWLPKPLSMSLAWIIKVF